jgi:hypothetical protein
MSIKEKIITSFIRQTIGIVIKQDFWKNPENRFISYNTKSNFFEIKKLFYYYIKNYANFIGKNIKFFIKLYQK